MIIQINTDNNINEDERMIAYFKTVITDSLIYFNEKISRIEVHFSDENGGKEGINDKKCMIETRRDGSKPIAVSANANSVGDALNSALQKMNSLLKTEKGQMSQH